MKQETNNKIEREGFVHQEIFGCCRKTNVTKETISLIGAIQLPIKIKAWLYVDEVMECLWPFFRKLKEECVN